MPSAKPSGQALVANYQTVFVSLSTIEAAHYEADRSEHQLLQHLQSAAGGSYLQPTALGNDNQDVLTRASLDAHIKKVQADQLDSMSAYQLQQLQAETSQQYIGKKVQITVRMPEKQPVEVIWFDQRAGYRSSHTKKLTFSGTIQEVLLDKNVLVVKPPSVNRLLNNSLQNYAVYIIDPDSLLPMVDIIIR